MHKQDLALNYLQWLMFESDGALHSYGLVPHLSKKLSKLLLPMVDMPLNLTKPNHIYLIYMYKEDFVLNNLQGLICR